MLRRGQHVSACDTLGVWVALLVDRLGFENVIVFVYVCELGDLRV
jgi:hypothetical protein